MNLIINQSASFKKTVKKLKKQLKAALDEEIKKIIKIPTLGKQKKGDLDFLRVYKFKFSHQEFLLGYAYQENELILTLLKFGTHENFYRDFKHQY